MSTTQLRSGMFIPSPSDQDFATANELTQDQLALYEALERCSNTEEGQGRAASLKRQVAALESLKHVCLQFAHVNSYPEFLKRLIIP